MGTVWTVGDAASIFRVEVFLENVEIEVLTAITMKCTIL
jgi:hypothetical protein